MKLFGSSGSDSRHMQSEHIQPAPRTPADSSAPSETPEQRTAVCPKWLRITAIVLGILLLLVICAAVGLKIWAKPPEITDSKNDSSAAVTPAPTPETPVSQQTTPAPTPTPEDPEGRRDGVYTFLLAGTDQASGSTDTLLVGSFDTEAHVISIVSIPRDTMVNVPWSVKKINSCYSVGGSDRLLEEMGHLLGFTPDFYGVIQLKAFRELVDTVGGIYFEVPVNMNYDDPTQDLSIHISAGYQLLNGQQAEGVLRCRNCYADADIGRIQTQQDFLKTAARQFLSLGNIPNLSSIVTILTENTETNLTSGNLLWLAGEFLKMDTEDIHFYTMPGNTGDSVNGGSYVTVYLDEWLDMINDCLNPFNTAVTRDNLNILTKENGVFYSTTGTVAGGEGSFYDYNAVPVSETGEEAPLTETSVPAETVTE